MICFVANLIEVSCCQFVVEQISDKLQFDLIWQAFLSVVIAHWLILRWYFLNSKDMSIHSYWHNILCFLLNLDALRPSVFEILLLCMGQNMLFIFSSSQSSSPHTLFFYVFAKKRHKSSSISIIVFFVIHTDGLLIFEVCYIQWDER